MVKKGQIFILSVLILGGVVALGLILITAFTSHLHLSVEAKNSLQAFYLADSKAEVVLYNSFNSASLGDPSECSSPTICSDDFGSGCPDPEKNCYLKTTATYQGVTRSSEYYFPTFPYHL